MICEATMEWAHPAATEDEAIRFRKGDPDALASLMTRYQHRLYRYLIRLVREEDAAADLFQQTWLRVMQNARRYDPRRSLEAWLFSVAHNLAIDHLRRKRPEELDEGMPRGGPDAFDQTLAEERATLLAARLAELPAVYREVVTLRFEEELKLEEIAEATGAPLSTVKSRLRRALEQLRSKLEPNL